MRLSMEASAHQVDGHGQGCSGPGRVGSLQAFIAWHEHVVRDTPRPNFVTADGGLVQRKSRGPKTVRDRPLKVQSVDTAGWLPWQLTAAVPFWPNFGGRDTHVSPRANNAIGAACLTLR